MKILALVAGIAGATALAQFPEASTQYVQRLAGAVDELSVVVADFDRSAEAAGLTRYQALDELTGTAFLNARNADMTRTLTRYEALNADLVQLRAAGPLQRLFLAPARFDTEIGLRTYQDFQPALPVTFSGLSFAALGFLAGSALFALLSGLVAGALRRSQTV